MKKKDLSFLQVLNKQEMTTLNGGVGYGEEWQVPGALDGAREVIGYIITFPFFLF